MHAIALPHSSSAGTRLDHALFHCENTNIQQNGGLWKENEKKGITEAIHQEDSKHVEQREEPSCSDQNKGVFHKSQLQNETNMHLKESSDEILSISCKIVMKFG